MKKIFLKAMLLCVVSCFCVGTALADESHWNFTPETGTISGYTGPGGDVVIPDTYAGFPVTAVGSRTFYYAKSELTSVTMPDSITLIGEKAFQNCEVLTTVNFSQNLLTIEEDAFSGCDAVTEWIFPDSLTSVRTGNSTNFFGSLSATYIRLPANKVAGCFKFSDSKNLTNVDIPDEFEGEINLFFNVDLMSEVYFPGGVTVNGSMPVRATSPEATFNGNNSSKSEYAYDAFTYKVYENTPAHYYCVERKLQYELLGEWVQPTVGASTESSGSEPSVSAPSESAPSNSTPSVGNSSSSSSDDSNHMVTLAIIGGVTLLLCVGVVVIFMKKK